MNLNGKAIRTFLVEKLLESGHHDDEVIFVVGLDEAIKGDFTRFKVFVLQINGLAVIIVP